MSTADCVDLKHISKEEGVIFCCFLYSLFVSALCICPVCTSGLPLG